ncbi:MAG: hypothetical protein IPL78_22945 [Chloroflexi bacterium]|nr:hypothetical protein [Chloroflexota bacterium]
MGDLLFLAPATGNLYVQSGSVAIDAGVDAGIMVDFAGKIRPSGAVYLWATTRLYP